MDETMEIHGHCDEKFLSLKEVFTENLRDGLDVGASLAVTVNGEYVVDLWGGYTSYSRKEAWKKDTIVTVFSTTKIMTALCALMLVDRGDLALDAPVARYWPEFGQNGKENVLVRHIFSHSAGLPSFDKVLPFTALYDWNRIVDMLARQKLWWEPGTDAAYHAQTFGFILGELVQRIAGKSIGNFFRTEIAEKVGADFYIGLPEEHHNRVAKPVWTRPREQEHEPGSIGARMAALVPQIDVRDYLSKEYRMAEIPAANGHGNARSMARVGSILALGGELDGIRFLSKKTIEKILEEQIYVYDPHFGDRVRYGLGLGLPSKEFPLPNPISLHWGGFGGSYIVMDLDARLCIAFAMNNLLPDPIIDPRKEKIQAALFACMENL